MIDQVAISTVRNSVIVSSVDVALGDVVVLAGETVATAESCLLAKKPVPGIGYVFSVTPLMTGEFTVIQVSTAKVLDRFECVVKTSSKQLSELWDREFGNWSWDKQTGLLTATDLAGNVLAKFQMVAEDLIASQTALPTS